DLAHVDFEAQSVQDLLAFDAYAQVLNSKLGCTRAHQSSGALAPSPAAWAAGLLIWNFLLDSFAGGRFVDDIFTYRLPGRYTLNLVDRRADKQFNALPVRAAGRLA